MFLFYSSSELTMDTFTINHCLREIARIYKKKYKKKLFYHVSACDLLPKELPIDRDCIFVINLDVSSQSGSHWVALFISATNQSKKNKKCRHSMYFDSYGLPPSNTHIRSFIKKNSNYTSWNHKKLQSDYSIVCGIYCIIWCLSVINNDGFSCFFNEFNKNYDSNDEKVQSLYGCVFENRLCIQRCKSYLNCMGGDCDNNA